MNGVPSITTAQMREVDRAMIEDFHIELIQMMENAGRNLAHLARRRFLDGDPREKNVVILVGRGGNGGGGLVCARRLHNWGANVQLFATHPDDAFQGVPAHQLGILRRMGVSVTAVSQSTLLTLPPADLIIDAIIGYSLQGKPHGAAAEMINQANLHQAPTLSLDAPSGLDTTTGTIHTPTICANATMTLALPKQGLDERYKVVGELYLADISVPPHLYRGQGLNLDIGPIFSHDDIIRIK